MMKTDKDNYLIGFDLGTSAVKAVLSNPEGRILAVSSRRVELIRGENGIIEIDPELYYQNICSICRELVSAASGPEKIRAVCFSGASGNSMILDEKFSPFGNAISWMDGRAVGKDEEILPGFNTGMVYEKVGWPFSGTFPLAHLGWIKSFKPDLWKQASRLCMLNDYIYYRLSSKFVVDYSKATTFFLQNQKEKKWDEELLGVLGIKEDMLAELVSPGTVCGNLTSEASRSTGLDKRTMIVSGSFDHPSAARGTGVFGEGDLLISAGTSWVAFTPIRDRSVGLKGGMLIDPFLSPDGCWGAMFALTAVAEILNEYIENCFGSGDEKTVFDRFNSFAADAEPGAGGFFLNLYEQPYKQMKDKLQELSSERIARALMEGIVFLIRNKIEKLAALTGNPLKKIVLTGGPTKSPVWPSILADVLGRPVFIPEAGQHAGAMGAVVMAGIGAGIYSDEKEAFAGIKIREHIVIPDTFRSELYQEIYRKYTKQFNLE